MGKVSKVVVRGENPNEEAKLGAGGMADTRDPEPFVNETDKRQSISQAPSFEEYLKSRQFAADSRKAELKHGLFSMLAASRLPLAGIVTPPDSPIASVLPVAIAG